MTPCPHCAGCHGVSLLRVWSSGPLFAAICGSCGKRFHPALLRAWVVAELVSLLFFPMAATQTSSLGFACVIALGMLTAFLAVRAFVPLTAIR